MSDAVDVNAHADTISAAINAGRVRDINEDIDPIFVEGDIALRALLGVITDLTERLTNAEGNEEISGDFHMEVRRLLAEIGCEATFVDDAARQAVERVRAAEASVEKLRAENHETQEALDQAIEMANAHAGDVVRLCDALAAAKPYVFGFHPAPEPGRTKLIEQIDRAMSVTAALTEGERPRGEEREAAEAEDSLADIAAGRFKTFASGKEAAEYLLAENTSGSTQSEDLGALHEARVTAEDPEWATLKNLGGLLEIILSHKFHDDTRVCLEQIFDTTTAALTLLDRLVRLEAPVKAEEASHG